MKKIIKVLLLLLFPIMLFGQIEVQVPIELQSNELLNVWDTTASKAVLFNRVKKGAGQITWVDDIDSFYVYNGTSWSNLSNFTSGAGVDIETADINFNGTVKITPNLIIPYDTSHTAQAFFHIDPERGSGDLDYDSSFVVTDKGYVGIGTKTPLAPIDIRGGIESDIDIYLKDADYYNIFIGAGETKPSSASGALNIGMGYNNIGSGAMTTGNNNVSIGHETSTANETGEHNVVIGNQSFRSNISGGYNVVVGTDAMAYNISGHDNVAVGHKALNKTQTTWYSTGVGYRAAEQSIAEGNTALGSSTLITTTTGKHNLAVGAWSLYNNLVGQYNTAIGTYSGYNFKDSLLIAIGYRAAQNETGSGKLVIANGATSSDTFIYGDSLYQIGIGTVTPSAKLDIVGDIESTINLYLQDSDPYNLFLGSGETKPSGLSGSLNISIGASGFGSSSATSADNNISIGNFSSGSMTTGDGNTVIGNQSFANNTTGSENTSIGKSTLGANTTGNGNTALGNFALSLNSTADYSTGVGYWSLKNNIGTSNTAIGVNSLINNTTGIRNTAIGSLAGFTNTVGDSSVFIGNGAGYHSVASNVLIISNTPNDSLIYGEFDNDLLIFNGKVTVKNTLKTDFICPDDSTFITICNAQLSGASNYSYAIKSANYTITSSDNTIEATVDGITLTLPAGTLGTQYSIINVSSGLITVDGDGTEEIGNASTALTYSIASDEERTFIFNGTYWRIKGK